MTYGQDPTIQARRPPSMEDSIFEIFAPSRYRDASKQSMNNTNRLTLQDTKDIHDWGDPYCDWLQPFLSLSSASSFELDFMTPQSTGISNNCFDMILSEAHRVDEAMLFHSLLPQGSLRNFHVDWKSHYIDDEGFLIEKPCLGLPFDPCMKTKGNSTDMVFVDPKRKDELVSGLSFDSSHDTNSINSRKRKSMEPIRSRLSIDLVRAIFEAARGNSKLPKNLNFQVVLGSNGPRISPPSYEYEEGLYIVTKPLPKNSSEHGFYSIPKHLITNVMQDCPEANCPWNISGPQLRKPTEFQQRYLSPKGDTHYNNSMGGTLWTAINPEGQEDLEYRLLHVYRSTNKRTK